MNVSSKRISLAATTLLLFIALTLGTTPGARAQGPNQVGLIVGMDDGSTITRCIEFNEDEISGYDVLMRSGLQVEAAQSSGLGVTICKIGEQGCPADNCFCQCQGSTCTYWVYWHVVDGAWSYSSVGANGHTVRHGDVEGWIWGEGNPPPLVPFDQICAAEPTATPQPTNTPTATPAPPTNTPLPTPSVRFEAQVDTIVAGQCTELRWDVDNVQSIHLDGQGVTGHQTQTVCPTENQTYKLQIQSVYGEASYTVTVNVLPATPTETLTPTSVPTETPLPTPTGQDASTSPTNTPLPTETPLPVATATPKETETAQPTSTATLAPTNTPQGVAAASPTVTLSPTPLPTLTATVTRTPTSLPTAVPKTAQANNYVFFGVIIVGLMVTLVIVLRRK